jgi:hypothetical protein
MTDTEKARAWVEERCSQKQKVQFPLERCTLPELVSIAIDDDNNRAMRNRAALMVCRLIADGQAPTATGE